MLLLLIVSFPRKWGSRTCNKNLGSPQTLLVVYGHKALPVF